MNGNPSKHRGALFAATNSIARGLGDEIITTCPKCGGEISLWTTAAETTCNFCHYRIFENERTTH